METNILSPEILLWRDSIDTVVDYAPMFALEYLASALPAGDYPQKKINELWCALYTAQDLSLELKQNIREFTGKTINRLLKVSPGSLAVVNASFTPFTGLLPLPESWAKEVAVYCNDTEMPVWTGSDFAGVQLAIPPFSTATLSQSRGKSYCFPCPNGTVPVLPESIWLREDQAGLKKPSVRLSSAELKIVSVKKSELSDDLIVKIVNPANSPADGALTAEFDLASANITDAIENNILGEIPVYGNKILLHLLPENQLIVRLQSRKKNND